MLALSKWLQRAAFVTLVCALLPGIPQAAEKSSRSARTVAAEIDRHITARLADAKIPASGLADDAEFCRRLCIDITGKIPTADRAAAFIDSTDPDKRAKLIDELLASPEYGRHFATIWTNLITANGDPDARPATKPFATWLAAELNQGRGWDKLVSEMLTAQGTGAANPATFFTNANASKAGELGNASTKLFLGLQVACAECHDHPFNKWTQNDYWGMAAFFGRLKTANNGKNKDNADVMEVTPTAKAAAKNAKKKDDAPPVASTTGTIKIPATGGNKGAGKVVPAKFLEGERPMLPAEGAIRPNLAAWMTSGSNPFFARAASNRLWGHFFGRGFVNPLDDFLNGNEPSHPELLALLSQEFIGSGHDFKHLIRCICNSQTYQRTSATLPGNKDDEQLFSHMAVKVMMPEAVYDSLTTAMGTNLPGGLISQARYGDGKGKNAKGAATAKGDGRDEFVKFFRTKEEGTPSTEFTHGIPQLLGLMNNPQFNRVTPSVEKLVKAGATKEKAI
jgi:Protein of unknown function (DUF1549)/Protein of unknown function (DUF1553)